MQIKIKNMKELILILGIFFPLLSLNCKGQKARTYNSYDRFFMYKGDTIGKMFHIIGIPFDTILYVDGGDAIIDINEDGLKDNIGRMQRFTLGVPQSIIEAHKNDTINQLCVYLNEGDSVFRYKTRSSNVLSDYYMPWYSILPNGNDGFCIKTEGRKLDWNKYYLFFKYDKRNNALYLVKSLVEADYGHGNKKIVEEKVYNDSNKIPFEKINFDLYFKKQLDKIPQPQDWRIIKTEKAIIYSNDFQPTKMYMIKDDRVRIEEEKNDFYRITFLTETKKIEGWIKKDNVE
jgi:hypothetical protein